MGKMKRVTHEEAKDAIQKLDEFLPTEKKAEDDFKSLPVDFHPLYEAGHDTSDRAHKLGADLHDLAKFWGDLQSGVTNETAEDKVTSLTAKVDSTVKDAKKFRKSATDLDIKMDETIGEVMVARGVVKQRIADDEVEKKRVANRVERARIDLEKKSEGNWFDQINNSVTIDLGSGDDPFGIDSGQKEDVERKEKEFRDARDEQNKVQVREQTDQQTLPVVNKELNTLQALDGEVADLENLARQVREDLLKAQKDLKKEQKTHNVNVAEFYQKRLGKDMKELLSWVDAFPAS